MPDFSLTVRGAALVTGASRGIGKVIAAKIAGTGVPVVVHYRTAEREAGEVVRRIENAGGSAVALRADVALPEEARTLFEHAEGLVGPIGLLVNNAGATNDRLLIQMTEADWDGIWSTNLAGARSLARRALNAMCARGSGNIVNVSSVVGWNGNAGQANYASAKAALLGLTREMAVHAAPSGVRVNCVVPGYIVTDATAHLNESQRDAWLARIPMGRYATPDEVADVVMFLAGPSAGYITGHCLAVDGGLLAAESTWSAC